MANEPWALLSYLLLGTMTMWCWLWRHSQVCNGDELGMKNYYEILGVSPTSETKVITAAYKAMMRKYHPDNNKSASASDMAKEINAAYEVLKSPLQRREYGAKWSQSRSQGNAPPPSPPPPVSSPEEKTPLVPLLAFVAFIAFALWLGSTSSTNSTSPGDVAADATDTTSTASEPKSAPALTAGAEAGNARAQSKLGNMLADGTGVAQDYAAAVSWYRKAADQRNAMAQNNLAGLTTMAKA
jgi:curved DNA-binding protein CbpA